MRLARIGAYLAIAVILAVSCSDNEATPKAAAAGGGGSDAGVTKFGESPCGTCAAEPCASTYAGCNADPGCAAYLECLLDCPVADDGFVDEACAGSCPIADSSSTKKAVDNVDYCLARGDGADTCIECGNQQTSDPDLNQMCGASMETNPCWVCEDESCCETAQRCKDNPECVALIVCQQDCGDDDACFTACYDMHPDGLADYGARLGCVFVLCHEECVGDSAGACSVCTAAHCADEYMACQKQPECLLFQTCIATCTETQVECYEGCLAAHPESEEAGIALGACANVECAAECGGA